MLDYDLESSPLEVKTNSVFGSDDELSLLLFTTQDNLAGMVKIKFSQTPQHELHVNCQISPFDFPYTLPTAAEKIWRIAFTRGTDSRLQIHCNEVEVVNILISGQTCDLNQFWTREILKILFDSTDSASDFYRPYKGKQPAS